MIRLAVALLAASVGHAAGAAPADRVHDCVIEPRATVALGSPAEGILREVLVTRGDVVRKGMPLARLESGLERLAVELAGSRVADEADIRSRREQFAFRQKEVARLESMRATQVAAERDYDVALVERRLARFALEAEQASREAARIELRRAEALLARREIRAPDDGVVTDVAMAPGEFVHEQSVLMTIAELDPLHVEVFVPVTEHGRIAVGMQADILPEMPVGGVYRARVVVVDPVFDAASRTFGVRLMLPNPGYSLPGGLRCTLRFTVDAPG